MAINYRDIVHPEDEKALRQLQNTPGVKFVAEKLTTLQGEKKFRSLCMASCVKLGPNQLPEIYNLLPPIAEKLGMDVPELYLEQSPEMNAMTTGDQHPIIVIYSGLVSGLTKEELASVMAHECGHILCHHCLYKTVLNLLTGMVSRSMACFGLEKFISPTILYGALPVMCYWSRRSELSADRVSLLYTENLDVTNKALVRLASGPISITENLNLEEIYLQKQIEEKQNSDNFLDKLLYSQLVNKRTHPFVTTRIAELNNWQKTAQYRIVTENIKNKTFAEPKEECPGCHHEIEKAWKFCHNCGYQLQ